MFVVRIAGYRLQTVARREEETEAATVAVKGLVELSGGKDS